MNPFIYNVLLYVILATSYAQNAGDIKGRIIDQHIKQPLESANISVLGTRYGATTDEHGFFTISNLKENVYTLQIHYIGYSEKIVTDVLVVRNKITDLNEIELVVSPIETEAVEVLPEITTIPISHQSLQREEIRKSPGTGGDVLRAVGSLPGVSTSDGEFAAMSVRGGGIYDNLILIDNIPFEKINHFEGGSREQETQGGRYSVFTEGLIEKASFYGGGFSSKYGGKSSSVLDLQVKEGNTESFTVDGIYNLLGLELNYDGPSYLFNNTSMVVNYRNFDMESVLEMADEQDFGDPSMSDLIIKTTTALSPNQKLNLIGLYSKDRIIRDTDNIMKGEDLVENDIWDIDEKRWLYGANWRVLTSKNSVQLNTLYYRGNSKKRSIGYTWSAEENGGFPKEKRDLFSRKNVGLQNQKEAEIGLKSDINYAFSKHSHLNFGLDVYSIDLDYNYAQNGPDTLYEFYSSPVNVAEKLTILQPENTEYTFNKRAIHASVYSQFETRLSSYTLISGVRYSYNGFNKKSLLSPRFQLKKQFGTYTTLNFGTGIFYQKPRFVYLAASGKEDRLEEEKSVHYILGLNHLISKDLKFNIEGYFKTYHNLIVPSSFAGKTYLNKGDGWSSGVDVMLSKRFSENYYGQLTYSYSKSKRNDHDGLGEYDAPLNLSHNLTFRLGYEIDKSWYISARWKYSTGKPKSAFNVHQIQLENGSLRYAKEITGKNTLRVDDFHNLSIRADYRKQFGFLALVTFLELDNIYNKQNIYEDRFSELTGKEKGLGFGFLPNFGFKLEF